MCHSERSEESQKLRLDSSSLPFLRMTEKNNCHSEQSEESQNRSSETADPYDETLSYTQGDRRIFKSVGGADTEIIHYSLLNIHSFRCERRNADYIVLFQWKINFKEEKQ